MRNVHRSQWFPFVIGIGSLILGLCLSRIGGDWPLVGGIGAGIWAAGSSGTGVFLGRKVWKRPWIVGYLALVVFLVPTTIIYAIKPIFPPLLMLKIILLLGPVGLGFWLGFTVGASGREPVAEKSLAAPEKITTGGVWLVIIALQACVIGTALTDALWHGGKGGFWGNLALLLWFPVGVAVCAPAPWAWLAGVRFSRFRMLLVTSCGVAWVLLLGYAALFMVSISSKHQ